MRSEGGLNSREWIDYTTLLDLMVTAGAAGHLYILALDLRTDSELCSLYVLLEGHMFKIVVQEAATLAALSLFVGMVAIWSQVIGNL